jgi:hypothetical protein
MRMRPVRPNIYLPVVRFGVADSDWFTVLLISCAGYLAPVPFGITILYVPLQLWTWLLATAGSIAFFNYIRIGRKPYWLQHKLKALCFHHRQYRAIPNGRKRRFDRTWLIGTEVINTGASSHRPLPAPARVQTTHLLEENHRIQEAWEEKWKALWLTTN